MDDGKLQSQIMATAVESGKAMGSAMKSEGKEEGLAELYKLNQVWYRIPPTLSLVSKRTVTKCQFQQSTYTAPLTQKIASAIFNTGEFQVNGKTSFLVIQAGIDKSTIPFLQQGAIYTTPDLASRARSTVHAYLGQGGILNTIDEITFLSASGTEVDRQQNKGLQISHVVRNRNTLDWFNTAGESQGYPGSSYQDCYDAKGYPGYVEDGGGAAVVSPWLIPSRATHFLDRSKAWLGASSGATNTNATTISLWDTTKMSQWGQTAHTGSVDVSFDPVFNATYNSNPGQAPTFIVPLGDVLGMFSPYMNALIPSQALAGGRIELRFKDMNEALIATGPAFVRPAVAGNTVFDSDTATSNASTFLNGLQIYDIYFLLDSFQLNEGTLRRLNEAAAGNEGLSVMFDTWDWTQTQTRTLAFEAQVAQARSRILRSFCVIRDQMQTKNPWANSLASEAAVNRTNAYTKAWGVTAGPGILLQQVNSYQAQLGSLYFPQQPLTRVEEYLMNSYYTFSKQYQDNMETNSVSLSDFVGANGRGMFNAGAIVAPVSLSDADPVVTDTSRYTTEFIPTWAINWGSATYGFLAERSQLLQLSGLPISNARLLRHRFNLNYLETSGTGRYIDVFTEYTRVMKVFLGGRIVMRE